MVVAEQQDCVSKTRSRSSCIIQSANNLDKVRPSTLQPPGHLHLRERFVNIIGLICNRLQNSVGDTTLFRNSPTSSINVRFASLVFAPIQFLPLSLPQAPPKPHKSGPPTQRTRQK